MSLNKRRVGKGVIWTSAKIYRYGRATPGCRKKRSGQEGRQGSADMTMRSKESSGEGIRGKEGAGAVDRGAYEAEKPVVALGVLQDGFVQGFKR